jgi:hypothetical protein
MGRNQQALLAAVGRRLAEEPDRVLTTLQVIVDPDALVDEDDESTISLARTVNAHRVVAALRELRARAYPTDEVRELLGGISRQAVSQRVRSGRLMAIEISGRSWFPDWQFVDGRLVDGLPQVVRALIDSGENAFTAEGIMRTALPEEGGRSVADLLARGELGLALHYIRAVGGGF